MSEVACDRLFDEVPCYLSLQDRDFRIVRVNRALLEDFGEAVGRQCFTVYKGRAERCPECVVARTFEDGKEHSNEEIIFDRRGLPHDVLVRTRPLRDPNGEISAVMQMFTDVTVQKELEHRLHDSLTRFHHLFDMVPCYISVQDRELHILEANDRFKETFDSPPGRLCYQIYKRRKERCPECPVEDTFADGKVHTEEHVWVDRHGKELLVVVQTAPIRDAQGNVTQVMKVSTDITEVRALQDRLASLGRLVGGIAHSIKNVLEGLRGGVYIANLGFLSQSSNNDPRMVEMVLRMTW